MMKIIIDLEIYDSTCANTEDYRVSVIVVIHDDES